MKNARRQFIGLAFIFLFTTACSGVQISKQPITKVPLCNALLKIPEEYKIEKLYESPSSTYYGYTRPENVDIDLFAEYIKKNEHFVVYKSKCVDSPYGCDPRSSEKNIALEKKALEEKDQPLLRLIIKKQNSYKFPGCGFTDGMKSL